MNKREKLAAGPLIMGLLFCTSEQLICCIIGVALLGIGALTLNTPRRIRPAIRRTHRTVRRVS